ncbi:hypothetical protein DFA_11011 [Cavenderia fasciculata]|uniref:Uncharacterized protein n=1 Tax=Cavenderia fasciculata TaxID=261658 RepID=F4QC13_CACFS|nr:uncharacterized protein DFA_11011 [Cavenderia fasciculata]EGG14751.1 hypothetical protein DFA_11011 [Cavenderia fasciculata]|eukprot:XP_004351259.1 hypothetical protein DFA_11011 [Cavenderia fasciculata]
MVVLIMIKTVVNVFLFDETFGATFLDEFIAFAIEIGQVSVIILAVHPRSANISNNTSTSSQTSKKSKRSATPTSSSSEDNKSPKTTSSQLGGGGSKNQQVVVEMENLVCPENQVVVAVEP